MLVEFAPGHRFLLNPGRNQFWLPPGRYHVQLWSQYAAWRAGKATIDIDTTRGPVWFHYAAPMTIYHRGAAGFQPQQRPGKTFDTALITLLLLCVVGSSAAALLSLL
ncbi:hypothetical protein [Nocardia sp. X0981]